ncbi:MAG: hypothetical protein U1F76_17945 [Candidatus Competibacteraceae bacterium]
MDKIPLMGFTRGIFEIFIPGAFLLLNFYFALYMIPYTSEFLKNLSSNVNDIILALVIFSFSYLLGVILRIMRVDWVGKKSACLLSYREWESGLWYTDEFPYRAFNERSYARYFKLDKPNLEQHISEIKKFFEDKWITVDNNLSFNFIKMILICEDEIAAKEIYAAESLSRYIASMFYCLFISDIVLLVVWLTNVLTGPKFFGDKNLFIAIIFIIYLFGIYAILKNFHFIRHKEVDTVFALAFKYRECLFSSKGSGSAPRNGNDKQEPE